MCEEDYEHEIQAYLTKNPLRRREFALGAAGLMATFGSSVSHGETSALVDQDVLIDTPDGQADCYFVAPASGEHPAVIMWPDIKGLRPAFRLMGQRLATAGYAVLVVNPFYRDLKGLALPEGVTFPSPDAFAILRPMRAKLTQEAVISDSSAFVRFLKAQKAVDTRRPLGAQGYCMSGAFVMYAAAAMPDDIAAIASFHAGGLVSDADNSPHLTIAQSRAAALHAIAEADDEKQPEAKTVLTKAYADAGLAAEIEVYDGTAHGWCPPDSRVYDKEQADRAWSRLLALYEKTLKPA